MRFYRRHAVHNKFCSSQLFSYVHPENVCVWFLLFHVKTVKRSILDVLVSKCYCIGSELVFFYVENCLCIFSFSQSEVPLGFTHIL